MDQNVCGVDRVLRLIVGTVLLAWALTTRTDGDRALPDIGHHLAMAVGVELLATGLARRCPASRALGIDTCG